MKTGYKEEKILDASIEAAEGLMQLSVQAFLLINSVEEHDNGEDGGKIILGSVTSVWKIASMCLTVLMAGKTL